MEEHTDSRRTRDDVIRYWAPRLVAIAIGLVVGIAGFWSAGRDTVAFLANWSTFCIQAGAIYLFLFEREFLANLVMDFLEFVRRVRDYRERRAAQRAAAQEAVRRARTQTAKSTPPAQASTNPMSAKEPLPEAQPAAAMDAQEDPNTETFVRPQFRSRDSAFSLRAVVGMIFVMLIAALLASAALQSDEGTDGRVAAPPADLPEDASNLPVTPQNSQQSVRTHAVQDGESCWSVAADLAQGESIEPIWLQILAANPALCSSQRQRVLRPGSTLTIPAPAGD